MRVQEFQEFIKKVILDPNKPASPTGRSNQEVCLKDERRGGQRHCVLPYSRSFWCGVWIARCKAAQTEKVSWEGARLMLEGQLSFSYTDVRKGVYVDRFDEPDNVEFRNNTYLPLCAEIDRRAYRYVPLWWRADHTRCTFKEL